MNIDKIVYTKNNINQNNTKKKILFSYAILFSFLFIASLILFILLFMRGKNDVLSFILCCFLIVVSVLYVVANILTIKKLNVLNNRIALVEKLEQKLSTSVKVDPNKKVSTTTIMFSVCVSIITIATICSVVFLCLGFTLELMVETLFMVLILGYTSQTLFTSIIDDKIYKEQVELEEKE